MATTRAKFSCAKIINEAYGSEANVTIELKPVTSGSEENREFYKWTPIGSIVLGILDSHHSFKLGYDYYVDFTEAS